MSPSRFASLRKLCAAGLLLVGSATAQGEYHVSAMSGGLAFDYIMSEQYITDPKSVRSHRSITDQADANNLCVLAILREELDAAMRQCNRALKMASAYSAVGSLRIRKHEEAEIYSNRGVVKALQGNLVGAQSDFQRALRMNPEHENAAINNKYLSSRQVAMASTTN